MFSLVLFCPPPPPPSVYGRKYIFNLVLITQSGLDSGLWEHKDSYQVDKFNCKFTKKLTVK